MNMSDEEITFELIEQEPAEEYGYGETGNLATYMMLDMMDKEEAEEYRKELQNKDNKAYNEYLEFEKEMKKQ